MLGAALRIRPHTRLWTLNWEYHRMHWPLGAGDARTSRHTPPLGARAGGVSGAGGTTERGARTLLADQDALSEFPHGDLRHFCLFRSALAPTAGQATPTSAGAPNRRSHAGESGQEQVQVNNRSCAAQCGY